MRALTILAHSAWFPQVNGRWGFVALVLLILFVTLVATDGSKGKDR